MTAVPNVGKCFADPKTFLAYLDSVKFGAWRPGFVTGHHTGSPTLKNWQDWQTRKVPVTDEQWLKNLAAYYGNELGWSACPHFFFTPTHYCVLSPPDRRGVHAKSFNGLSWAVEMVGNFDVETMPADLRVRYIDGFACLHIAAGLKVLPYQYATQGLHFHRDDPKTTKTCAGKKLDRPKFAADVLKAVDNMTSQEAPPERITVAPAAPARTGKVTVPAGDTLNVRAEPSGKSPVVLVLQPEATVTIKGEATNVDTKWLRIDLPGDPDGFVAARFVK